MSTDEILTAAHFPTRHSVLDATAQESQSRGEKWISQLSVATERPGALSVGIKRPGREADRSPPVVPRSRTSGAIHPLPQYALLN